MFSFLRRLNKVALIALACMSIATAQEVYTNPTIIEYALNAACVITQMDCGDIGPPEVKYWYFGGNVLGVFDDTQPETVWLDYQFAWELVNPADLSFMGLAILIHETVHYLDHNLNGKLADTPEARCASEGMAWWATNKFLSDAGEDAYWNWRDVYPECSEENTNVHSLQVPMPRVPVL